MAKSILEITQSERFKTLIRKRWTVSVVLLMALFAIYYGFILTVAFGKEFLAQKVGVYTNFGILFGIGAIILAWALTLIYVVWANNAYDKEVDEIRSELA